MSSKPCTRCRSAWCCFLCSSRSLDIFSALLSSSQLFSALLSSQLFSVLSSSHLLLLCSRHMSSIFFFAEKMAHVLSLKAFLCQISSQSCQFTAAAVRSASTCPDRAHLPDLSSEIRCALQNMRFRSISFRTSAISHNMFCAKTLQVEVVTRKLFFLHSQKLRMKVVQRSSCKTTLENWKLWKPNFFVRDFPKTRKSKLWKWSVWRKVSVSNYKL